MTVKAHKEYLKTLRNEMKKLSEKFENGTIQDFEKERMDELSQEIRKKKQELQGF
ncbi:MAG: hypothetical protein L6282_01905 [Candidatus Methanoperedenaceae archaeon]|nr:hypothetical protein [Candidatus Methanoperedenaceae archaeon]